MYAAPNYPVIPNININNTSLFLRMQSTFVPLSKKKKKKKNDARGGGRGGVYILPNFLLLRKARKKAFKRLCCHAKHRLV